MTDFPGRYHLITQLGRGGQGSVWLAEDRLLRRMVALKELVPHTETSARAESRERALIEARAMARVRHRCIVRIHDIFFVGDEQDPWLVMEYIGGRSLDQIVREGRLPEQQIAAIGLSVLEGLRAVHAAKVVHRDVKPLNILADRDSSVYLVDFGIAKITEESSLSDPGRTRLDTALTGVGRLVGTLEYMAPEQLLGEPATAASDLWSLGVTLYFALEGYTPFVRGGGQPLHATAAAILRDTPRSPGRSGALADIALRLLHKDPSERPEAGDIAEVLESILNRPVPGKLAAGGSAPGGSAATGRPHGDHSMPMQPRNSLMDQTWPRDPEGMQRLADAELSRREMAEAVRLVNQGGTDSGVAMLLTKSDMHAAQILADCSLDVAADVISGVAAADTVKAGAILRILSITRSGQVFDRLTSDTGAAIVEGMKPDQAARILSRSDPRSVAEVVMALLPGPAASALVSAMPDPRTIAVLNHTRPADVAAVLRAMPRERRTRLLRSLDRAARPLVERYL